MILRSCYSWRFLSARPRGGESKWNNGDDCSLVLINLIGASSQRISVGLRGQLPNRGIGWRDKCRRAEPYRRASWRLGSYIVSQNGTPISTSSVFVRAAPGKRQRGHFTEITVRPIYYTSLLLVVECDLKVVALVSVTAFRRISCSSRLVMRKRSVITCSVAARNIIWVLRQQLTTPSDSI